MNYTKTLFENERCTIEVDALQAVARVIFDDNEDLGVLYPGYKLGASIEIPQGTKRSITIYNGSKFGPISFKISYSAAEKLAIGVALGIASLLY